MGKGTRMVTSWVSIFISEDYARKRISHEMFIPWPRRANDFLEFCMERYLMPFASERGPRLGPVLDLGCGNGRDTVYMAQHLPPGTRVVGVDNHSYALERGAILADKWVDTAQRLGESAIEDEVNLNVGPQGNNERRGCEWLLTDLRKPGSLGDLKAHVIHGHRFKCEQILPLLRDQVYRICPNLLTSDL